ncbi:MAG TPA: hypothetical protein VL443_11355 [Cyclobacteriaceae bacterium]|jgi:hypothetical protein|nr:hypothetical protein [Cyclobacteriaceae bacterium]
MNIKIFYSWQSDLPNKTNRGFIEDCIQKAIKKIHNADKFELLLNLDRDTNGEAGTPDIADTIFSKIKSSHIFIADISIITLKGKGRKTPNPNVLVELGFAAGILGWENIICIYNSAMGQIEDLPFDLRSRRPIIYFQNDTLEEEVKNILVSKIEKAIKSIDYNLTAEVKELKTAFFNESDRAKHLVNSKPEYWELQLIEELVRNKMAPINKGYIDLRKDLIFRKKRNLDAMEFFDWFRISLETYTQFYTITTKIFNDELRECYGSNNPIRIKKTIEMLVTSCQELLEWEIELNSLIVPDELIEIKNILRGASIDGFEEINSLPDKIRLVLKNIDSRNEHTIEIKHSSPVSLSRAGDLFKDYLTR